MSFRILCWSLFLTEALTILNDLEHRQTLQTWLYWYKQSDLNMGKPMPAWVYDSHRLWCASLNMPENYVLIIMVLMFVLVYVCIGYGNS